MPPITSKNLGLVRAIHSGTTAPVNIKMLWYNENDNMHYYYDILTATWVLLASGGGSGGTQTLSQTLSLGNSTGNNDISIVSGRKIIFNNSGFNTGLFANPSLAANQTVYLPSLSGTLALISDIPSLAFAADLVIKGTGSGIASGIIYDNGASVSIGTTSPSGTTKFTVKSGSSSIAMDILNSSNLSNFSVSDDGIIASRLGYWLNIAGVNRKIIWTPEDTSLFVGSRSGQSGNITPSATSNNSFGMRSLYNLTTGYNNNAFGFDALYSHQSGTNNNAFGSSALYNSISGSNNIAIGTFGGYNLDNPFNTISIGGHAEFANPLNPLLVRNNAIVIGFGTSANVSESYEALIGGNSLKIANLYLGQGRWSNATDSLGTIKLQITSPIANSNSIGLTAQSNASGVDFAIAGSQPTGSGNGGSLLFQIAPGGGASGTAARPLVTTLKLTSTKSIIAGGLIGTTATDGFVYISTASGVPTGTPTVQTGTSPLVVDTTNNRLYFYSGGVWNYSSGGGTVYSNGAGLNLTGTVFSIATSGVVNAMIANSTIDLTSKVTNTLPQSNGGTGFSTYATGDILIGTSPNLTKLGIGTNGQVLTVSGGTAVWSTASTLGALASGQIYLGNASNATALVTPSGDVTISNTGVTAIGNSKVTNAMIVAMAASKLTGVVSAAQGGTGISSYTTGDLLYYDASSFNKLAIGTNDQVLTVVSGNVAWANPGASSGWSLNGNTVTSEKWFGTVDNFDLPFRTNNTEKVRLTATGRLGIGTITPSAFLDITSTTALKGISLTLGAGAVGALINTNSALALDIVSSGGGINIVNTHGSISGIQITNTGVGSTGIMVDTLTGLGVSINSKFYTAGLFSQTGSLTANNTSDTVALYRNFSLNSFDATGSILLLNDDTASTGNFLTIVKQNVTKLAIKSTGVIQYIDGNQASGKVLTSDASGNATWQTAGGGTSYTFSTGLTNTSGTITNNLSTGVSGGQTVVGGTAANNQLTLSSTSNASKGKILFGTSTYNEFNNRLGLNTQSPGCILDLYMTNGASGFRLVNSDATTAAGGTIVGWQWTTITNGANTNLSSYEHTSVGGFTARVVYHAGGNVTIGAGSGSGDAKLHVIGTIKIADGSQGVDKIFRSDANGLGSWITAPWLSSPMTTIADIIQASATVAGGSPARLAGSATAGTFLRSQGTGVVNHWSTLVLPNAITTSYIPFATTTNTLGSSSELQYVSSSGNLLVSKNQNGATAIAARNFGSGSNSAALLSVESDAGAMYLWMKSTTNSDPSVAVMEMGTSEFRILNGNPAGKTTFVYNTVETARITAGGMLIGIGVAANPDASCILDLNSTTKGLRVPRMTTTERNAINITAKPGIIVYDITLQALYVSNSSAAWVAL